MNMVQFNIDLCQKYCSIQFIPYTCKEKKNMNIFEQLILPLFSFIFFITLLQKWRSIAFRQAENLPPSPKGLPVIGNLHQLGNSPHRSLHSLSRRYNSHDLLLLRFGRARVLLVSSAITAREVMKNQDEIFSNRPKLSMPDRLMYGSRSVAFTAYGEYWRQVRSICVIHLLSNKRVQSFRAIREQETSIMVDKIRRESRSSSPVINLSNLLASVTNDVICRVALASYSVPRAGGEYIPWFGWITRVNGLDSKVERVAKQFDEFLENVVREHKDRGRKHEDLDLVDILLELRMQSFKSGSLPIEDDTIKALILNVFAAGSETTSIAIEWAMAELIKNPRTMKTVQNEVRRVARSKKEIVEDDLEKMPYLKAVLKEALRLHPPGPLLVPRECTHDTKVMGYDVLAGTRVLINAWAIARDRIHGKIPKNFDLRGSLTQELTLSDGILRLAKLVYHFNFALPNGEKEEDLDMSEDEGFTVHKRLPLLVVPTLYEM
ncbi:cytochrome P450 [Striga asiatica]|uniref:Cytochrome P450 n=1 Tax=Striga asiatica TaxID=4170 RepID=A0A5A7RHP7_STRAF|nr:cytochrome P450 [Striga asiatica]